MHAKLDFCPLNLGVCLDLQGEAQKLQAARAARTARTALSQLSNFRKPLRSFAKPLVELARESNWTSPSNWTSDATFERPQTTATTLQVGRSNHRLFSAKLQMPKLADWPVIN